MDQEENLRILCKQLLQKREREKNHRYFIHKTKTNYGYQNLNISHKILLFFRFFFQQFENHSYLMGCTNTAGGLDLAPVL